MARWLSLDFAQREATVALGEGETLVRERTWPARQASEEAVHEIGRLFAETGTSPASLDGLAWMCGPGSFTGLRVAAATIQGLAWVWNKPVASLSALQVMAYACRRPDATLGVCSFLDARMHELYWACYGIRSGVWPEATLAVAPPGDIELPAGEWIGVGELPEAVEYQALRARMTRFEPCPCPRAGALLPLAELAFRSGRLEDAGSVAPLYVRHAVTARPSSSFCHRAPL